MSAQPGFLPKQAKPFLEGRNKVSAYENTGGKVTTQFSTYNLSLIPPIPPSSIIHDNACGSGTVSRVILSSNPTPSDITIHATDTDQVFLDVLASDIHKNTWPIEASNQKSEALSFPDDYFTHSITNIGIFFFSSDGLDGAKEIYRTLKPGGTAIVNCWAYITWYAPIMMMHNKLRPDRPMRPPAVSWLDGQHLQKVMTEAGFQKSKMRVEKSDAWARTKDVRKWGEMAWAFLGGMGRWSESDEERWEEGMDMLEKMLMESETTKVVDGEVCMRASQWVVVAEK